MGTKKLALFELNGIDIYSKADEKNATSLETLYCYWKEQLLNRIIRIFEWTGLPFEQHEMEKYCMLNGKTYVAFHDKDKGFVTGAGAVYGVTRYDDVFTDVQYAFPDEGGTSISGNRRIGEDAVVLYNTSLSMPMRDFLCRYASLLAHGDLSYKSLLISRRSQEVLVASDASTASSINDFFASKYKGQPQAILDTTMRDIQGGVANLSNSTPNIDYMSILDAQMEMLRAFYRDLGIRWTRQKRGNMTEDEVDSDGQMLLFNIRDMLHCRERFCEEYNRVFSGRAEPISVKVSSELEDLVRGGGEGEENLSDGVSETEGGEE